MVKLAEKTIYDSLFYGYQNIDTRKFLLIFDETYVEKTSLKKQLKKYINSRWFDKYDYRHMQREGNNLIAFYSDFYFRKDHFTIFNHFIEQFPYFDYVIPERFSEQRFNFWRGITMLKWDVYNLWQLKNVNIKFKKKLHLIRILGLVLLYCKKMKVYLLGKTYSYGLVYSDTNPYENILVQFMKQNGLHTGTLQHGIFDKRGYWKGLEFRASVADDWLAWNPYTKKLAMECGILEDNIKVLGIPRYIRPVKIQKNEKKGIFSVILGGKVLDDENKKLIGIANMLAKDQSLKYFLRYHPICKGNEYETCVNRQFCIEGDSKEEVPAMCEKSDFSLVGSGTSMIIDLIYLGQQFFQYYEEWNGKECNKRNNYFRNYDELAKRLQGKEFCQDEETFVYYCTTLDVKQSYDRYFKSL